MRNDDTASRQPGEPPLSAAELAHTGAVAQHIRRVIESNGGWISFEQFMDLALYAPGLGYYSGGARKIGRGGDFTTAPEVSRLFGCCVARQCAQVLQAVPGGSILEVGAGTGRLAVDVLRRLESLGALPMQYLILEVSADLRERQRELLARELPRLQPLVAWLDAPPVDIDGVILANEVLDALPVARFEWNAGEVREIGVQGGPDGFSWAPRPASTRLSDECRRIAQHAGDDWPRGYMSELCPRLQPWTLEVTRGLRRGLVLWIDYGLPRSQYYLPERQQGTLICHFRQRIGLDPLRLPGLQDITAWVDFTALAEAGQAAGFEIAGFTPQTYFLAGNGIDAEMQSLAAGDEPMLARLAGEARQLLMPGEMGERFKAMGWSRELEMPLAGFEVRDFTHSL